MEWLKGIWNWLKNNWLYLILIAIILACLGGLVYSRLGYAEAQSLVQQLNRDISTGIGYRDSLELDKSKLESELVRTRKLVENLRADNRKNEYDFGRLRELIKTREAEIVEAGRIIANAVHR